MGVRALAVVDAAGAALVDEAGEAIDAMEIVLEALVAGARADSLVVDGFLTKQATQSGSRVYLWSDDMPSMGSLMGLRRNRAKDTLKLKEGALEASTFAPDDEVSFIAIDLLWLDDMSLLDVPLLERRRLLEGVIEESDVVRLGAFVRPPIETWVGSWRAQGFAGITFKAANSRYLPGAPNPDWVISGMPRR
jgi:ATP-dependent DNA ligase